MSEASQGVHEAITAGLPSGVLSNSRDDGGRERRRSLYDLTSDPIDHEERVTPQEAPPRAMEVSSPPLRSLGDFLDHPVQFRKEKLIRFSRRPIVVRPEFLQLPRGVTRLS